MKKITKRALSMTITGLLLMNTFAATAFADNGHHEEHENNGHGYGHEYNKDWFENGHDNGHHGHKEDQEQEEQIVIELPEEEKSEEEQIEQNSEEQQVEEIAEETSEEESSEETSTIVEGFAEAVQEALNETEEETEEEASEEVEEEAGEETEEPEEAPWESYTLYNYISLNEGTTYISLNTQENGITAAKPAAEFHRENNNKRYDLSTSEYEIADYDLTELVITSGGVRFVEQSVAEDGQAYFIARLDRVEAVAAAPFRASSCVEGIESFKSLGASTITFHRNWYLTLVTPEIQLVSGQKLLTGVKMPDNKYYGIDFTDDFKAVDSRMIAYGAKLNEDQYEIEDYDFTNLTLTYKNVEYAYRPDGPVAGDGNGFHYYTVKFLKLDKVNKSTYGGGYLVEGWPAWPLTNANAADPDGFPYTAGYYHRDYTVSLHVGDAPAVAETAPVVEEPVAEEPIQTEEPQVEEPVVEEPVIEEQPAPAAEEIVEEAVEEVTVEEIPGTEEAPAVEETVEEITETTEEPAAEEEPIFAAEEVKAPARTHKRAAANTVEPAVNEATTNQTETVEEETSESIEDDATPMAAVEIAAAETEEILEEELPLAAAPFEAVKTAQVETAAAEEVASVETEAPSVIEVASIQVADFIEMDDAQIPMAAAGNWSLASMIFGVMSVLLAIFTIASKNLNRGLKAAAIIALAATAAVILITSDFSGMMVTSNRGTLAVVILNIFEAVFASTATNEARLG